MKSAEEIAEELAVKIKEKNPHQSTIQKWIEEAITAERAEIASKEADVEKLRSDHAKYESIINKKEAEIQKLQQRELKAIRHLNHLATWAQQDPTGPWEKFKIQEWVLNEIKSALGQEIQESPWIPEVVNKLETELLSCAETIQRMRETFHRADDLLGECVCTASATDYDKFSTELSSVKNQIEKLLALPPHASEKRVKALEKVAENARLLIENDPATSHSPLRNSLADLAAFEGESA